MAGAGNVVAGAPVTPEKTMFQLEPFQLPMVLSREYHCCCDADATTPSTFRVDTDREVAAVEILEHGAHTQHARRQPTLGEQHSGDAKRAHQDADRDDCGPRCGRGFARPGGDGSTGDELQCHGEQEECGNACWSCPGPQRSIPCMFERV